MKVWYGYGSEHSANLVMIGSFKDARDAGKAKEVIDQLAEHIVSEVQAGTMETEGRTDRYSDKLLQLLQSVRIHDIGPAEMEQFAYDFDVKVDDDRVVLTTDESDVSAFLKVLIDRGARVEVYSAHEYPDGNYGRGK